jgi:hypothetical protein
MLILPLRNASDYNSPSTDMFNAMAGGLPSLGQLPTANLGNLGLPTGNLTAVLHAANRAMGMGRSPSVLTTPTAGDIHVVSKAV